MSIEYKNDQLRIIFPAQIKLSSTVDIPFHEEWVKERTKYTWDLQYRYFASKIIILSG